MLEDIVHRFADLALVPGPHTPLSLSTVQASIFVSQGANYFQANYKF